MLNIDIEHCKMTLLDYSMYITLYIYIYNLEYCLYKVKDIFI